MLIDASALTAIFAGEDDFDGLLAVIDGARQRLVSPTGIWEGSVALSRLFDRGISAVEIDLKAFFRRLDITIVPITAETSRIALDAHHRFGKGRHPANLNFGDCFAYASAREHGVPLLYKGDDFALTDIKSALG